MGYKPWRSIKHKRREPEWTECYSWVSLAKSQPRLHSMTGRCQVHRPLPHIHLARYAEPTGATVTITWTDSL